MIAKSLLILGVFFGAFWFDKPLHYDYKTIEVLTAEKTFDTLSIHYKSSMQNCLDWTLNKDDIKNIIEVSEAIDGPEWHHFYLDLPCYYYGKVLIDGTEVGYEVNAGATTLLFYPDTVIRLGYKKDDFKKYFVEGRDKGGEN